MTSHEQPRFDEISLHLEIETVARELSTLDETLQVCRGSLAEKVFERFRMELLRDPAAYMIRQAETARLTWQHQPVLARYLYQENDND